MAVTWNITDGVFSNVPFHVAIPNASAQYGQVDQEVTTERRLQVSEKALIDGADVEDFGRKPRTYSATVIFFGADYSTQLKAFEDALNSGTTGVLILPDMDEAVNAKFQKSSRKTSAQDGNTTVLQVSWIEDQSVVPTNNALANAQAAIFGANTENALPTVADQAALVKANAIAAESTLTANPIVTALQAAQSAVVNTLSSINNVVNIPRNARQDILNVIQTAKTALAGAQAVAAGISSLADALNLGLTQASPTRYNTGLDATDFVTPDSTSTTVIAGASTVQVTTPPSQNISSFDQGVGSLQATLLSLQASRTSLESSTQGNTDDYSQSSVILENSMIDLIAILQTNSSRSVMTVMETSLLEVCFQNGLSVSDLESVHALNSALDDILDIPPYTMVNL